MTVLEDGQRAIDVLREIDQIERKKSEDFPCLVLLDLNLPQKSGHDVLQWIRNSETLRNILVIILTSSSHDQDVHRAYRSGANAYVVKPPNLDQLIVTVTSIREFWLKQNHAPASALTTNGAAELVTFA